MRYTHLLTIAVVSAAALISSQSVSAADTTTYQKTQTTYSGQTDAAAANLQLPAGITAKELNDDKSIEKSFQGVTNDGLSKNGFDNLITYLNDQDSDRVKKSADVDNVDGNKNQSLVNVIKQIQDTFKSKYNTSFDLNYKDAYNTQFVQIMTGQVADANQLVGQWPLSPTPNISSNISGKVSSQDASNAKNKYFGGDVNLDKGRDVAVANLHGNNMLPALTVSLIHEHTGYWHFDIPNDVNAKDIYNTLVANLDYLNGQSANWPSDVNQTYRDFTTAVVAAMYNVNISSTNQANMNKPGEMAPTANNR